MAAKGSALTRFWLAIHQGQQPSLSTVAAGTVLVVGTDIGFQIAQYDLLYSSPLLTPLPAPSANLRTVALRSSRLLPMARSPTCASSQLINKPVSIGILSLGMSIRSNMSNDHIKAIQALTSTSRVTSEEHFRIGPLILAV